MSTKSRFCFYASAGDGLCPWPVPPVCAEAAVLMASLLNNAVARSPRLAGREFTIALHGENLSRIKSLCDELMTVKFPMPVEGGEMPVPALEDVSCHGGTLRYRIGDLYGSHLLALGLTQAPAVDPTADAGPEELSYDELETIKAALRCLHAVASASARFMAVQSAVSGRSPVPQDAFRVEKAERLLARLGELPGGANLF